MGVVGSINKAISTPYRRHAGAAYEGTTAVPISAATIAIKVSKLWKVWRFSCARPMASRLVSIVCWILFSGGRPIKGASARSDHLMVAKPERLVEVDADGACMSPSFCFFRFGDVIHISSY